MNDRVPTVQEVVAEAMNARQQLAALEQKLQEEIDEIDFTAFREQRQLTADEGVRRRSLRSTQGEVRDQFAVLAYVTARRLDETNEVAQLLRQMQTINAGLQDDFDRLRRLQRYSAIAERVADAAAQATAKLAAIAAKIA